ncbi:MAG: outer membrane lipoprotein carrier protein LolA [Candidatus Scalinduaceae bacterium]
MQFKSFTFLIPLIILLSFGCATHKPRLYLGDKLLNIDVSRIKTLSFLQVKEDIVLRGQKLTSLKADAKITLISPEINKSFKCKGVLRFQKPKKIRVIGSKFASTVFDILSDGENYWFHLPKQKVVYTGKCDITRKINDNAYIFPDDIGTLLDYGKLFEGRSAFMETWPAFWFIHVFDKKDEEFLPYGKLKIDRVDNNVTELILFKKDSSIKVQAFFGNYTKIDDQTVPEKVQINWPETGTTLILILNNLSINEPLKPEIFKFKKPRKADIIKIS